MFDRSWFWLRDRILALLAVPPAFAIEAAKKRQLIPSTRLQWVLQAKQSQEE